MAVDFTNEPFVTVYACVQLTYWTNMCLPIFFGALTAYCTNKRRVSPN